MLGSFSWHCKRCPGRCEGGLIGSGRWFCRSGKYVLRGRQFIPVGSLGMDLLRFLVIPVGGSWAIRLGGARAGSLAGLVLVGGPVVPLLGVAGLCGRGASAVGVVVGGGGPYVPSMESVT